MKIVYCSIVLPGWVVQVGWFPSRISKRIIEIAMLLQYECIPLRDLF